MAKTLIQAMDRAFDPAMYHDTYQKKQMDAIQSKIQGQEIAVPNEEQPGVIDHMEAMKTMLAQQGQPMPPPDTACLYRCAAMSLYEHRDLKPMLLSETKEPFDSPNYLYELKLDGIRCLAYVSPEDVDLRNKSGLIPARTVS